MVSYLLVKENKVARINTFFRSIENKRWGELKSILHDEFTFFLNQFQYLSKEEFIEVCKLASASFSEISILADNMYEEDELIKGVCALKGRQEKPIDLEFLKRIIAGPRDKQPIYIHERFEMWIDEDKILAFTIHNETHKHNKGKGSRQNEIYC